MIARNLFFAAACAGFLMLTGCGREAQLRPKQGKLAIPVAQGATRAETPRELIKPSTQARPARNIDIVPRSDERQDDGFNLPPGPKNGK